MDDVGHHLANYSSPLEEQDDDDDDDTNSPSNCGLKNACSLAGSCCRGEMEIRKVRKLPKDCFFDADIRNINSLSFA